MTLLPMATCSPHGADQAGQQVRGAQLHPWHDTEAFRWARADVSETRYVEKAPPLRYKYADRHRAQIIRRLGAAQL
jgi:hypothetical protein